MTHSQLWFTRARLKREAPDVKPLINTLLGGDDAGHAANTTHRLLWTLMPSQVQRQEKPAPRISTSATFLWCAAPDPQEHSTWYVLGPRPRSDGAFFDVDSKPWEPAFSPGDRLRFDLTVNATVDRMMEPSKGREGRHRTDLVLDAITAHERGQGAPMPRAAVRRELAETALRAWWSSQGSRHGFAPEAFSLEDYRTVPLPRGRPGGRVPLLGIARLRGVIEVNDPAAFVQKVNTGFGRAKAFGCGLMLLKRMR